MAGEVFSKLITSVNPKIMNASSRGGHKIDRIVIHHNATTNKTVAMNTWVKGAPANTSAHYEVTPTEIVGCVGEQWAAWHCGGTGGNDVPKMSYPNQRSIGIENVNSSGAPKWSVDHRTVVNCAKLVADICKRYGIPCDRKHVLGHKEVTATACPGGLNVDEVVKLAKGYLGNKTPSTPSKPSAPKKPSKKSVHDVAVEVINRKWGDDPQRSQKLKAAGYNPTAVQKEVNNILSGKRPSAPKKHASSGWISQKASFTVTVNEGIVLRSSKPSVKAPKLAVLPKGSVIKYDAFCFNEGYVWIRQPRSGGKYGYLPTGEASGNKRKNYWGKFK